MKQLKAFLSRHTARNIESFTKRDWWLLGSILAGFSVLALGNITRWSIWFDEAFSAYLIRYDYGEVAKFTAADVHPPLYYWLLKAWTTVFGTSELGLRSFSLVCIGIAIVLVYLLVRQGFSRWVAGSAIVVASLSPMLIRYSEEARMYGMVMAIVAAATYVLALQLKKPTKRRWVYYGVLVSLGMWTHYYTALAWIAHWVWRSSIIRSESRKDIVRRFFSKEWLWAHALAIVLFSPWLPTMLHQMFGIQGGGFWIKPITLLSPVNLYTNLLYYRETWEMTPLLATVAILIAAGLCWLTPKAYRVLSPYQRQLFWLIASLAFVPTIMLLLLSLPPLRPSYVERYLLVAILYWSALIGVTLGILLQSKVALKQTIVVSVLTIGAMIFGIVGVYQTGNYNKNNGDLLQLRWTIQEAQSKAGSAPVVVSAFRYYEAHYYQTDEHPMYYQEADKVPWGSFDMMRASDYRKVQNVATFAQEHGGVIWWLSDWSVYGKPDLPVSGKWKVIEELHAPALPNDKSGLRAAKIQLEP